MKAHPAYSDDQRKPVPGWTARPTCRVRTMVGRAVRIEPFDSTRHATAIWEVFGEEAINERIRWFGWPWIESAEELVSMLEGFMTSEGWSTAVISVKDQAVGMASYMREDAANGAVEIGAVAHSDHLARTVAATEAHHLLMSHAFGLGYRRYEWKCDDANHASKDAAERLGFTYEGAFRNHKVNQGRSRDTAWYSITDDEWPEVNAGLKVWNDPSNFDLDGRQIRPLATVRSSLRDR